MNINALKFSTALCLLGSGGFAAWAISIWLHPALNLESRPISPWSPSDIQTVYAGTGKGIWVVPRAALDRPLFLRSRRPFMAPVEQSVPENKDVPAVPPALPPVTNELSLKGIAIYSDQRSALIASPQAPGGVWVQLGGTIDGWTMTNMQDSTVTLKFGSESTLLKLYVDNPAMAVGSTVPQP